MVGGDVTPAEFAMLCEIASDLGCTHLKLTGGEPTVRRDLADIVERCAPFFDDVSMTTNGLLLSAQAERLAAAGLDRVNVSLDTLDNDKYREVTGGGDVSRVVAGIRAARDAGLSPVKVNMVVLKGFNVDEVPAMMAFARAEGAELQLIELHTDRTNAAGIDFQRMFVSLDAIEAGIAKEALRVERAHQHGRPRYVVLCADHREGLAESVIEVVRPFGNPDFCSDCQRMRLTGDGRLKPCLMRMDNYVDILGPLRAGASRETLTQVFLEANRRRAPYWFTREGPEAVRSPRALPVLN